MTQKSSFLCRIVWSEHCFYKGLCYCSVAIMVHHEEVTLIRKWRGYLPYKTEAQRKLVRNAEGHLKIEDQHSENVFSGHMRPGDGQVHQDPDKSDGRKELIRHLIERSTASAASGALTNDKILTRTMTPTASTSITGECDTGASDTDIEIRPLEESLNADMLKNFSGERTGYVRVGPNGYLLPASYAKDGHHLRNFKPRSTDTWVVTFPRSGTTWTQEMVWLIQNGLDYETAKKLSLNERFPFLEFSFFLHPEYRKELEAQNAGNSDALRLIEEAASPMYRVMAEIPESTPRFIKTHLPLSLLPRDLLTSGAKVIYVARNPKDVAISYYHLNRTIMTCGFSGEFEKYWNYFENNLQPWSPYWSHLSEGWAKRTHPNLLFMFYEEISQDTKAAITKMAKFLEKDISPEQVNRLAEHLNIANFRNNPSVNSKDLFDIGLMRRDRAGYVRNGKVGGWVSEFTPELSARADRWIHENLIKTDIEFPSFRKQLTVM